MLLAYDVFISYNREDRTEVDSIVRLFREQAGLTPWIDHEQIIAGEPVMERLDEGLRSSRSCAVFVGKSGLGPWEVREFQASFARQVSDKSYRVIPVLLATAPHAPQLPSLLSTNGWVDLRTNTVDELRRLLSGIRGTTVTPFMASPPVFRIGSTRFQSGLPSSFSADVQKIVSLLVGDSLYARQDVFVRELIQNAIDACERRRLSEMQFTPVVSVSLNQKDGWFQVTDNGDGMNAQRLTNSFAVIGKSIRDETDILQRLLSHGNDRLHLISKFGIGFISSFIASERICVSTVAENSPQINFTIEGITKPFAYSEKSSCAHPADAIGTTVRVYLKQDMMAKLDLAAAIRRFVRHAASVTFSVNGKPQAMRETWNTTECVFVKKFRKPGSYEMALGVEPSAWDESPRPAAERHLTVSSGGFWVADDSRALIPHYTPSWISGEINFWPGAVDLNIARDTIVANGKTLAAKNDIRLAIRSVILEYVDRCRSESSSDDRIRDIAMLYYLNPSRSGGAPQSDDGPILTAAECMDILLDEVTMPHGKAAKVQSLRAVVADLKSRGVKCAYTYWNSKKYPTLPHVSRYLRQCGYLVFENFVREVSIYGARGETREVSEYAAISKLLADSGIKLVQIDDMQPRDIDGLSFDVRQLPKQVVEQLQLLLDSKSVAFVSIPGADAAFRLGDVMYINAASSQFEVLVGRLQGTPKGVLRAYLLGLTQQPFDRILDVS